MNGPFIRRDVAAFLAQGADAPPMQDLPVPVVRAMMRETGQRADIAPAPLPLVRDLTCPGPGGPVPLRLYDRRAERESGPLILFFHGGGFVFGDLASHDAFCRTLADRCDLPVLAVDYRLAPEHPFPAFAQDAEAAARWVAAAPAQLGRAVTGLVTCGDSAGGHLALLVGQRLGAVPAPVPVLAQWVLYPFVGGGENWPSVRDLGEGYLITRALMGWFDTLCGRPGADPLYCLLNGPVPATPLLMLTASLDPLRDQGLAYARLARAAGAPVTAIEAQGMIHGFVNLRRALPSATTDVETFLRAGLAMIAAC
jgi:acetyl esterase